MSKKFDEAYISNIVHLVMAALETEEKEDGVLSIDIESVELEKFDTGKAEDQVYLKDVVTLAQSPNMGAGLMEMKKTTFPWTLSYDEFDYIIDGELSILINGNKVTGKKGQVLFIPKGSSIQFSAPEFARFMYFTYPADWASQKEE